MRVLLEIARADQITKAASNLNVSQPAISRLLVNLEKSLGVTLFTRTRDKMVPTEFGDVLVRGAERAFKQLDEVERDVRLRSGVGRSSGISLSRSVPDHELLAVISVGKLGNVALAAKSVSVSQTAINRSLASIEKRIGRKLFERSTRLMVPTPTGEVLIRKAQIAFSEIRQAKEELDYRLGNRRGNLRLRVGALPLSRVHLVPMAVSRLAQEVPEAAVMIIDGSYETLVRDLCSGELDIIVGTIRDSSAAHPVTSEILFDDSLIVVARSGHPVFSEPRVTPKQLAQARWIVPHRGVPMRTQFEAMLTRSGADIGNDAIEVDSFIAVRSLLLITDWFAVVSSTQIYHEEASGTLRRVPIPYESVKRPVGITLRSDYSPSRCVECFIKHIRIIASELGQSRT